MYLPVQWFFFPFKFISYFIFTNFFCLLSPEFDALIIFSPLYLRLYVSLWALLCTCSVGFLWLHERSLDSLHGLLSRHQPVTMVLGQDGAEASQTQGESQPLIRDGGSFVIHFLWPSWSILGDTVILCSVLSGLGWCFQGHQAYLNGFEV